VPGEEGEEGEEETRGVKETRKKKIWRRERKKRRRKVEQSQPAAPNKHFPPPFFKMLPGYRVVYDNLPS